VAVIRAGQKVLFRVHAGRCADSIERATAALGRGIIAKARQFLAERAPVVSMVVEEVAALRRGDK
jgi:hypothetical protein